MSLNRIITEALDGNPVGLKEAVSKILAEKIELALEAKMNESTDALDKHISTFSKKLATSSAKPTRYISDGKAIPGMKHVEVSKEHNHQDVFDALKSMGYSKTKGFDPSPANFTARHNSETMTMTSDPVHHKDGISAHFEHEHGSKMKVHFKAHAVKEDLDEDYDQYKLKQIHKDYNGYKALSTADLLRHHKGMRKISGNYTANDAGGKQGMIASILRDKHSDKHLNSYFDLKPSQRRALDEDFDQIDENWSKGSSSSYHADRKLAGTYKEKANDLFKLAKRLGTDHEDYHKTKAAAHAADAKYIKHSYHAGQWGSQATAKSDYKDSMNSSKYHKEIHTQRIKEVDESVEALDEITQTERRNLAFFEKQAVRAAEKANVGALSRAEKEAWIDDYLAKNHIPKGAAGSAVYSGVIKVRPIKESLDEADEWKNDTLAGSYKSREGGSAIVSKHPKKNYWFVKHSDGLNTEVPLSTRYVKAYINRGYLKKED